MGRKKGSRARLCVSCMNNTKIAAQRAYNDRPTRRLSWLARQLCRNINEESTCWLGHRRSTRSPSGACDLLGSASRRNHHLFACDVDRFRTPANLPPAVATPDPIAATNSITPKRNYLDLFVFYRVGKSKLFY